MLSDQPVIAHGIIIRTKGSAPQVTGAHMLIGTDSIWQTIGGGALEYQLYVDSQTGLDARAETQDSWHRQVMDIVLGPDVGQCCGGQVKILLEFYRRAEMDYLADLAISGGAIAHPLRSGQKPELLSDSTDMSARLTADSFILPQTVYRRPLFIYGAGHVGRKRLCILPRQWGLIFTGLILTRTDFLYHLDCPIGRLSQQTLQSWQPMRHKMRFILL